jgi:hypothetical protein
MQKTVSTEQMASNIAKIIDLLADVPNKLESLSRYLSKDQLSQPLGPENGPSSKVLAHLINCEARSSEAIYRLETNLYSSIST